MQLPTVQAVERKITVVGAALRYCLRFLTPATIFYFVFALCLRLGAVKWLPEPWSLRSLFVPGRYLVISEAAYFTSALGLIALLICIVAAFTTLDDRLRMQRPLFRHVVVAVIAAFGGICLVPAFND